MTAISAKQMQSRLQQIATKSWLENQVQQIVLSDNEKLKEQKIKEFTKGERPNGEKIGEYRSAEYAIFKQHINPLANGYVDLLLTRQFSSKLFVRPFANGFMFNSTDKKTSSLIGKYGIDILGLNQDFFNQRQKNIYKPVLDFEISRILNKR
jgi:hypothetical protein